MPRRDDDSDDDLPRRHPRRRDHDDDLPARSRRRPADDVDDDRPRRRKRYEDDDDLPPPRRKKKTNVGLIVGIVFAVLIVVCGGGGVALYYAFTKVGGAAERAVSTNNMKQIGIGFLNCEAATGEFPTNSYGPDGRPLLSWRVHLLPYVEEAGLYQQFHLNEPWDSPHNRTLLSQMPATYATPADRSGNRATTTKTYYRGFSNPGAVFERRQGGRKLRISDIRDGMANTILVVEAGEAVEWTKPDDLDASPGKPFPALGGARPKDDMVLVLFMDGFPRPVKKTNSETSWRAATTYSGGEVVNLE